ncbi:M23 family metallopeptidase [Nocardioides sp. T2.26MG-1]|uniref:M23 family metallopeptidase n=1 Tax=Nocardioides sp. T2.26MG-1 TaxID=3041166 RepID=UPI0024772F16|nr:M23 family metallopeptidase [Nocardioides sp. T2.26MG-1]CAI9401789.1 hypothetical protein HIDPHFAB_00680 [Nocardioides sp. T2.26MG-1]
MTKGLLSWDAMGAILASAAVGCAGYVGFTVVQVVSVATADDPAVAAVAAPPLPASPAAPPASDAPSTSHPASPYPAVAADAAMPSPHADETAATEPSARPTHRPRPTRTRPTVSPRPARSAAKPVAESTRQQARRQEAALKHALWADRQLAAMLRETPVTSLWFGGAGWTTPVAAYHLTARFGETSSLWASSHTGLDFAAPTGTPVRAATAGTVTFVGWAGAYGNKIEITHPDGSETWYAHLSRTDVRVGSQVGTGAVIGAVGATGNVTGPHLHFEVRPGGDGPVDPEVALRQHGVRP